MSKTIRAHQVSDAAELAFGKRLKELVDTVRVLTSRVSVLEGRLNSVPINPAPTSVELLGGNILNKGKVE